MNEFEKNFLKKEVFKKLLKFQSSFTRPQLIGLISLDNCLDFASHYDHYVKEINSGNIYGSYEHYEYYCQLFSEYLSLLEKNETIYPSKEIFINSLFINGSYQFLNFSAYQNYKQYNYFLDNTLVTVTHFEKHDFHTLDQSYNSRKYLTRISKNNVIRFYDGKIYHPEHWDDSSCYMTLSLEGIADDEFNDLFASSKFKTFKKENFFNIHKFINKLIKSGESYTNSNPTNAIYEKTVLPNRFDTPKQIFVIDILSRELVKKEIYQEDSIQNSYSVGDIKSFNEVDYELVEIKSPCDPYVEIYVQKVNEGA